MTDFAVLRQRMVDNQIRTSDVVDHAVIDAFLAVPREVFVRPADRALAYSDRELPFAGEGGAAARHLASPVVLARLVQALALGPGDRVLDVACGYGYSSAILSLLAGQVVALEEDHAIVREAAERLAGGTSNVTVATGPLVEGFPPEAPYDAILIAGGVEFVPENLARQLGADGRMAAVEMRGRFGRLMFYERSGADLFGRPVYDAVLPVLPGFARPAEFVF